ncbi:MAG: LysR family transcriptional regulator, partial [Pseudomonas sp.]
MADGLSVVDQHWPTDFLTDMTRALMADLRTITFDQLVIFIAVVESGSQTRAASRLGIGKTAVTTAIQRLESQLGAGLLIRTTRKVDVTEAGREFYKTCQLLCSVAEEALSVANNTGDDVSGTLRIAASVEYSATFLVPVLTNLRSLHPRLKVELISGDRFVDLIEEGIDIAIRLGHLSDSTYRANKICDYSKWLMASPGFVTANSLCDDMVNLSSAPYIGLSVLSRPFQCKLVSSGVFQGSCRVRRFAMPPL